MNIVFYFSAFVFGGIGALALIRVIERFAVGAGFFPVQIGFGFFFLIAAAICVQKARAKPRMQN